MERSGTQGLDLFFDTELEMDPKLLEIAFAHIARWKFVRMHSWLDLKCILLLRKKEKSSAPMLEYFSFAPAYGNGLTLNTLILGTRLQPTVFIGGAPKLSYVQLDNSVGNVLPPLANVTTLRLEVFTDPQFQYARPTMLELFLLPSLVDLSICGAAFDPPDDFQRLSLITMNSLKHLRISVSGKTTTRHDSLPIFMHLFLKRSLSTRSRDSGSCHTPIHTSSRACTHCLSFVHKSPQYM